MIGVGVSLQHQADRPALLIGRCLDAIGRGGVNRACRRIEAEDRVDNHRLSGLGVRDQI